MAPEMRQNAVLARCDARQSGGFPCPGNVSGCKTLASTIVSAVAPLAQLKDDLLG